VGPLKLQSVVPVETSSSVEIIKEGESWVLEIAKKKLKSK
jgi:hypothetical protein